MGKLTARHLFNPNQTLIAIFQWQHDAVGNVTQQTERWLGDTTRNNALRTTTMAYDDVYRLLGETVTQSGEITKETLYTYDDASNRASKVEKENTVVVKDTSYTYNTANQLIAWSEENGTEVVQRSAVMTYDTRGNRASTAITTHDEEPTTATTTYTWTPQNMLSSVTLPDTSVHSYAYDYRVRRITRTEGSANPVAMTFSGGLSVAEFEVTDSQLNTLNSQPSVEYQRGPDMGGGVGGLLYSLRSGSAKFNLSNGRGDVVAQSDSTGAFTWTASYDAYGKRPVETGSNLDRQRANTKEEDPTGLNNEGWRMRELDTNVWMSRDPAGFVDGPNLYAYVRQNPWSKFDPNGLSGVDPVREISDGMRRAFDWVLDLGGEMADTGVKSVKDIYKLVDTRQPGTVVGDINKAGDEVLDWAGIKPGPISEERRVQREELRKDHPRFAGTLDLIDSTGGVGLGGGIGVPTPPRLPKLPFGKGTPKATSTGAPTESAGVPVDTSIYSVETALSEAMASSKAAGQPTFMYYQQATKAGPVDVTGWISVKDGLLVVDNIGVLPVSGEAILRGSVLKEMWQMHSSFMKAAKGSGLKGIRMTYERIGADRNGSTAKPKIVDKTIMFDEK
ncbi:RHS repeat domain-containing protein [Roseimicrobium gellanilyticum]|uniref:RHS repeat domain-containing protein n=1 Tax=Roseimicrobium gellanilyticum TaxID=748857 RepID=UPI0011BD4B89|nr:RHS repeat-associated core domain-containing protein [Roseimicrobium gellanilyticum]